MSAAAASSSSASAVAAQQASIRALIAGNLYDTKIVAQLEEHVRFQIKTGSYDGEANRELLQLYAVAPDMVREDILSRLLLKALMNLPSPDFVTSLYLLGEKLHALEPVRALTKLHALLDTCAFRRFWTELDAWRANGANAAIVNFAEVKDFDAAIRRFITTTIQSTYSTISTQALKDLWNITDKKTLEEAVAAAGWSFAEEGKSVVVRAAAAQGSKDSALTAQRVEHPTIEQLAKLITAA